MKTNPNDPAFSPCSVGAVPDPGLTKREYFAAMILPGVLAEPGFPDGSNKWENVPATSRAVAMADALIAELNKEPKP